MLVRLLVLGDRGDLLRGRANRLGHGARVAQIGALHGQRQQRARLQVHGVLGLVRQVRAPVFHFCDLGVGVMRIRPILVGAFVFALFVQLGQLLAGRRLDPRLRRQPLEKLFVGLAAVAPHDRAQRRVGLQRGGIDRNRAAFQQTLLGEQLQHPGEHLAVRFDVDQAAAARDRRMIGRGFVELDGEKAPQRDRIGQAPSDAALAVDAFEVADQQAAEVAAGRQRGTAHVRRVELLAALFGEVVEAVLVEQLVEPAIKRMGRCVWQIRGGDPQPFLALPLVASSHCHETIIHQSVFIVKYFIYFCTFTTGC